MMKQKHPTNHPWPRRLCLLLAVGLLTMLAEARDISYTYMGQTVKYTVLSEANKTCATKSGTSSTPGNNITGELIIPQTISDGTSEYTVDNIGTYSFYKNSLTKVTLPTTLNYIGSSAFGNCRTLTEINMPETLGSIDSYAFQYCKALEHIDIPNGVTSIGRSAFSDCSNLGPVTLPNTVISIGAWAFSYCYKLTTINLGTSVKTIGDKVFAYSDIEDVIFPPSVTSIGEYPFYYVETLKKYAFPNTITAPLSSRYVQYDPNDAVIEDGWIYSADKTSILYAPVALEGEFTFPNHINAIGDAAFYGCYKMTSANLSSAIAVVPSNAFGNCYELSSISLSENMTRLSYRCFDGCKKLKSIKFPKSLTHISDYAFAHCKALESVILPDGLIQLGTDKNTGGCVFEYCDVLKSVVLPNTLTTIPYYTFKGCKSLTDITIPESITKIAPYAFSDCSALTTIKFGNNVETIGQGAFQNCTSLVSVVLPPNLTDIMIGTYGAFKNCTGLKKCAYPNTISNPFPAGSAIAYDPSGSVLRDGLLYGNGGKTLQFVPFDFAGEYVVPAGVTAIGQSAFKDCVGLTAIETPSTLTTIEHNAFDACTGLKSVRLNAGVSEIQYEAFANCTGLTMVTLPPTVMDLGTDAFKGCNNIKKLAWPWHLDDYGNLMTLKSWYNPEGAVVEGDWIFNADHTEIRYAPPTVNGDYVIPPGITSIGTEAYRHCNDLTSVTIPAEVTKLESMAFRNCKNLSRIVLQGNTALESEAFRMCPAVKEVVSYADVPSTIDALFDTAVYDNAVLSCKGSAMMRFLTSPWAQFAKFKDLESNNFTSTVVKDGFNYVLLPNNDVNARKTAVLRKSSETMSSNEVTIPATINEDTSGIAYNVDGIGYRAFYGQTQLNSVHFDKDSRLTHIGEEAFRNTSIAEFNMPASVTSIGNYALAQSKVSLLVLPESLVSLSPLAFANCSNLNTVFLNDGLQIPALDDNYNPFSKSYNLKSVYSFKSPEPLDNLAKLIPGKYNSSTYKFYVPTGMRAKYADIADAHIMEQDLAVNLPVRKGLAIGTSAELPLEKLPVDLPLRNIVWSSSNPDVVTVDESGKLTGLSRGTAKISMSAEFGTQVYNSACDVTVHNTTFDITGATAPQGRPFTIEVAMNNPETVTSIQCDILLPEGFTPVYDEYSDPVITLNRQGRGHQITANYLPNGTLRVLAFSTRNSNFTGSNGTLFTVDLVANSAPTGMYTLNINNIVAVMSNGTELPVNSTAANIKITAPPTPGDSNGDGTINVTDAVVTVSYILGTLAPDFNDLNADANGDGEINISDVTCIVSMAMVAPANQPYKTGLQNSSKLASQEYLYVSNFDIAPGEQTFMPIYIESNERYSAFQTDIYLPEGLKFSMLTDAEGSYPDVSFAAGRGTNTHDISAAIQPDGALRVIAFSTKNRLMGLNAENLLFEVGIETDPEYIQERGEVLINNTIFNTGSAESRFAEHKSIINASFEPVLLPGGFYIADLTVDHDVPAVMSVKMDGIDRYSSFETDIYLPNELNVMTENNETGAPLVIELSNTTASPSHSIATSWLDDGALHVVCSSIDNALFNSDSNNLIMNIAVKPTYFMKEGRHTVNFCRTVCRTPDNKAFKYADTNSFLTLDPNLTGIEDVEADSYDGEAVYYNLQGLRIAQPQPGTVYIKVKGNTASKVLMQ